MNHDLSRTYNDGVRHCRVCHRISLKSVRDIDQERLANHNVQRGSSWWDLLRLLWTSRRNRLRLRRACTPSRPTLRLLRDSHRRTQHQNRNEILEVAIHEKFSGNTVKISLCPSCLP